MPNSLLSGVQALDRHLRPGKLVFFRVYSGQLKKGDTIYNPRTRKRERVSRLMVIQGSERKDVDMACSGMILPRWLDCATSPPEIPSAMKISM